MEYVLLNYCQQYCPFITQQLLYKGIYILEII